MRNICHEYLRVARGACCADTHVAILFHALAQASKHTSTHTKHTSTHTMHTSTQHVGNTGTLMNTSAEFERGRRGQPQTEEEKGLEHLEERREERREEGREEGREERREWRASQLP